jgi:hypothetical protein
VLADSDQWASQGALNDTSGDLRRLIGHPTTRLIDMPAFLGDPYLEPGTAIHASDLEAWEKTKVRVSSGDAVILRTGRWARSWRAVTQAGGVRAILEHLGLPTACARLAPARGPPSRRGVEASAATALRPKPPGPLCRPCWAGGHGRRLPQGGCTLSAPAWRTALGLPSASFLFLSAPTRCPQLGPLPSYTSRRSSWTRSSATWARSAMRWRRTTRCTP